VLGAKLSCGPCEVSIDRKHADSGGSEELLDHLIGPALEGADENLGIDARAHEELVACGEMPSQEGNGSRVLGVGRIQESDQ
jgi:hypothetical protein